MQGRLSPQSDRGYQAFPWETWQKEFDSAAERGLEHIEWVLDSWRVDENPLTVSAAAVRTRIRETDVQVVSVCADYLMDSPLDVESVKPWVTLQSLVEAMQEVGATWLVVPCVDQASLRESSAVERLKRAAEPLAAILANTGIQISLESDLDPVAFSDLLSELDPRLFGVNYDIGNSAALGYALDDEFDTYGSAISVVHIKDRPLHGGSVFLGQGNADIARAIERLLSLGFEGPLTMQAFRDIEGVATLDCQLDWVQEQIESLA